MYCLSGGAYGNSRAYGNSGLAYGKAEDAYGKDGEAYGNARAYGKAESVDGGGPEGEHDAGATAEVADGVGAAESPAGPEEASGVRATCRCAAGLPLVWIAGQPRCARGLEEPAWWREEGVRAGIEAMRAAGEVAAVAQVQTTQRGRTPPRRRAA